MALPTIQSAFPKRRYKYGEYIVTLLSDIQSPDTDAFIYIAAVLREGSTEPEVYITCETSIVENRNTVTVKVLSKDSEHIIGHDPLWKNEQNFCDYALEGIQQMFQLSDETPIKLS